MFARLVTPMLTGLCVLLCLLWLPQTRAEDAQSFVARLKHHHQDTRDITAFSLKYHFLNRRYRDYTYWDFAAPDLHMSQRVVEVDFARRHFYDNDILYFAGGRLWDRVQYQNDRESYFYERDATSLGKGVLRRDMQNFDRFVHHIVMNVDFLAIRPLLNERNVAHQVAMSENKMTDTTTLSLALEDGSSIDYEFDNASLQLVSIVHGPLEGRFVFSDYQTTRGITYARKVVQYYDGASKPTYIKYNDHFTVIDQVEPNRLKLPEGYGPVLERGDGVLVAEEIAQNLYLVTDSSAVRNSLLQISGDHIHLYGAAGNAQVAERTIQFIHHTFPDKTIASVFVTHPHSHQIAGLKTFVDLGVEIRANAYTQTAIRAYPLFSDEIDRFRFALVEHEQTLDGVDFYVLESLRSKRQSFVHFRQSGIIFQSDFLHIPRDNTIATVVPSYSKSFIEFVREHKLTFHRIVGNYRNNHISADVVNQTYQAHL